MPPGLIWPGITTIKGAVLILVSVPALRPCKWSLSKSYGHLKYLCLTHKKPCTHGCPGICSDSNIYNYTACQRDWDEHNASYTFFFQPYTFCSNSYCFSFLSIPSNLLLIKKTQVFTFELISLIQYKNTPSSCSHWDRSCWWYPVPILNLVLIGRSKLLHLQR